MINSDVDNMHTAFTLEVYHAFFFNILVIVRSKPTFPSLLLRV